MVKSNKNGRYTTHLTGESTGGRPCVVSVARVKQKENNLLMKKRLLHRTTFQSRTFALQVFQLGQDCCWNVPLGGIARVHVLPEISIYFDNHPTAL